MEHQLRLLLFIQSKHEIFGEPINISADGLVQIVGLTIDLTVRQSLYLI
jgi:hypothetical protein